METRPEGNGARLKIGIFDSGLGGLALAKAIQDRLPDYDYLYLGDTKRVPYGNRSQETIHEYVSEALDFLFARDCQLIILACNTASAEALRKSQQEYLPKHFPNRRVLGVIIPTVESALDDGEGRAIGVLATQSTIDSQAFTREVHRSSPPTQVIGIAAPLLVPIVENDGFKYASPIISDYIAPLINAAVGSILLGCTHYCLLKNQIRDLTSIRVISQDEVVPDKLADYLFRHPEIDAKLSKNGGREYYLTDFTPAYERFVSRLTGENLSFQKVVL